MTISSLVSRVDFVGAGATDTFPYTFRIFSKTDLLVTQRDLLNVETTLVVDVDYTVSGVGDLNGGDIVLTAGNLTVDFALTIRRVRPLNQLTDIRNQGEFFPEIHEDSFDHQTMIQQQQEDEIDRSMRLPETISPGSVSTILPVPVADSAIRWNSAADGLENFILATLGAIVLPASPGILVSTTGGLILTNRILTGTAPITVVDGSGVAGNPTFSIAALGISTALIADDAVTSAKLQDDASVDANRAVTTNHIKDNAVTTAKILNTAVTNGKLAVNSVSTLKILDSSVTEAKIANDAVTADKLRDDASVDANRAVTTDHIRDGAITTAKLASGVQVSFAQIKKTLLIAATTSTSVIGDLFFLVENIAADSFDHSYLPEAFGPALGAGVVPPASGNQQVDASVVHMTGGGVVSRVLRLNVIDPGLSVPNTVKFRVFKIDQT